MSNEKLSRFDIFFGLFFLFFTIFASIIFIFGSIDIKPQEVGIRVNRIDIPPLFVGGPMRTVLGTGYNFFLPFLQKIEIIDVSVKKFEFGKDGHSGGRAKPLLLATRDNGKIELSLTAFYKVKRDLAYDFYKGVYNEKETRFENFASRVLANEITAEFASIFLSIDNDTLFENNTFLKNSSIEAASRINQKMSNEGLGLEIQNISVWDFVYTPEYETKLKERVLSTFSEKVERAKLIRENSRDENYLKLVSVTDKEIETIRGEGLKEELRIRAEADSYYMEKVSEGETLLKQAEGRGKMRVVEAFSGQGGANRVGLEMAEVLKGLEVIVLPSDGTGATNPLDIVETLKRVGIKK